MIVAPPATRAEAARFARFCLVGVSNTLLTLATFTLLTAAGVPAAPASALGFAVGAVNGYVLNRSWTFRSRRRGAGLVVRYVAVQALGATASAGGVALGRADLSLPRLAAECAVLPCVTAMTYALARTLVFGAPAARGATRARRPRLRARVLTRTRRVLIRTSPPDAQPSRGFQ